MRAAAAAIVRECVSIARDASLLPAARLAAIRVRLERAIALDPEDAPELDDGRSIETSEGEAVEP